MIGSMGGASICDPFDRTDELTDIADAILEQVACALGGVCQELQREPDLHVLGQHEHADGRRRARGSRSPRAALRRCASAGARMSTIATWGCGVRSRFEEQLVGVVVASGDSNPASPSTRSTPLRSRTLSSAITARTESPLYAGTAARPGSIPEACPRVSLPDPRAHAGPSHPPCPRRRLPSSVTSTTTPEPVPRYLHACGTTPARAFRHWQGSPRRGRTPPPRAPPGSRGSSVHGRDERAPAHEPRVARARRPDHGRRRLPGGGHVRPRGAPRARAAISRLRRLEARSGVRGRCRALSSSRLRSRESAIRRCCAPSCRLRSSLCRSFCPASILCERDPRSSSSRAASSTCRRPFSMAIPAAAVTASSNSGSSAKAGSCTSTATCAPSRSISVDSRPLPSPGSSSARPSRSAQLRNSGSQ